MKEETDFQRAYQAGVTASMQFLIQIHDQPVLAEDLRKYVLPGRNWKSRFQHAYLRKYLQS